MSGDRGERGPTGDTGQTGDAGKTGQAGERGQRGVQGIVGVGVIGERGQTGDHGQQGDTGQQGQRGSRGLDAPGTARKMLALYLFMAAVFGYLAYRAETNADRIERNTQTIAEANRERCLSGVAILSQFNRFLDSQITIELAFPQNSKTERRVASLEAAKIEIRPCD